MESVAVSPETTLELIERIGRDISRVTALVAAAAAAGEPEAWRAVIDPEEWRAALANATDALLEASAALRAKEAAVGAFAWSRRAGEAEGYERGFEEGRRARSAHLALVHRAAG